MIIAGRSITFRKPYGRTYGYRSLQPTLHPDDNAGVLAHPLPNRGNDYPDVAPASRRIIDGQAHGGMRQFVNLPIASLDLGPPPLRIRRDTRAQDSGAVQKGTGTRVTGPLSFDPKTDGGSLYIRHQKIPRTPITVTAFRRTYDFASTIPARGIAVPVK